METRIIENWGGNVRFRPRRVLYPRSVEEIQAAVKLSANENIRVIGSGHSWTSLCETDKTLLSLKDFQGVEHIDQTKKTALVRGGTGLRGLGESLRAQGLAMENLGDIDVQAITGALSTGTHGTGATLGVIATQLLELTLVTADAQTRVVSLESDPDLFRAAQVSLGALGVIAKAVLRLVPAYNLECVKTGEKLEVCLNNIDEYKNNNRNFEFFWFPYSDVVSIKRLNLTNEQPKDSPLKKYLVDVVYENGTFKLLSEISRMFPGAAKSVSKLAAAGIANGREVNFSNRIYATERLVRFYEMEYGVPAEAGPQTVRDIKKWLDRNQVPVHFPLEYRYVKGDDIYISPAYGRDTAFISVHMYKGMPYERYFRGVEEIFRANGGRPHWGKMHNCTASDLEKMYPKWNDFLRVRKSLDPDGKWLNPYLKRLFGVE